MTLLALSAQPCLTKHSLTETQCSPPTTPHQPLGEAHLRIKWWWSMRMPLLAYPGDLGSAGMSPCRANNGSKLFSPLSLLFPFPFYMPVDSVISQLDKLVRGSSGKVWHRGWSDCWVCRESGLGSCGRHWDISLGAGSCLGCSWLTGNEHHPHCAVLADQALRGGKGSFRAHDVMGTEGDVDGQCQPRSVRGCVCVHLCISPFHCVKCVQGMHETGHVRLSEGSWAWWRVKNKERWSAFDKAN